MEELGKELEELGLSPYEARVLLSLLRMGSANSLQLARSSGVPRTSTYQILESLEEKHLVERVPVPGPAVWSSPGRDEVISRLDALEGDRLRQHRLRAARVQQLLVRAFPDEPDAPLPPVHLINGSTQVRRRYEQLWAEATTEVLAFSRPPYSSRPGEVLKPVIDAMARGVKSRVLYQSVQVSDEASEGFRQEVAAYVEAGVEARIVDDLPLKLVVFDRQTTLLAITGRNGDAYPANLVVDDAGFAALQVEVFEARWASAVAFKAQPDLG
ncbi:MAG TPA: helix-turn-helix domain-containing protein [Acidimicrobiales bacterium]|nr:helix-turn-helix domain-containing protein [Acidimicrobiales bacterium]